MCHGGRRRDSRRVRRYDCIHHRYLRRVDRVYPGNKPKSITLTGSLPIKRILETHQRKLPDFCCCRYSHIHIFSGKIDEILARNSPVIHLVLFLWPHHYFCSHGVKRNKKVGSINYHLINHRSHHCLHDHSTHPDQHARCLVVYPSFRSDRHLRHDPTGNIRSLHIITSRKIRIHHHRR